MSGPGPVLIVGGCGAVGSMLAAALRPDHAVTVLDAVPTAAGSTAAGSTPGGRHHSLPWLRADILAPDAEAKAALRAAGTVILAVPDPVAVAALPVLAAALRPDTLLVETLSVKTPIAEALHTHLPHRPALGLNPMFAPALGLPGRPVAVVRHHDAPAVTAFVELVTRWGAHVIECGADDHDRTTAATQALTHAAVLAFGLALDRLDVPAAAAAAPPPHLLLRAVLARITGGTAQVYHDIQVANPYAGAARRALAAALTDLDAAAGADLAAFTELIGRAGHALGAEADTDRARCAQLFAAVPTAVPAPPAPMSGTRP